MFFKTVMAFASFGSLYAMAGDYPPVEESHLSFIFKEKQKKNQTLKPRWDFLSELTEEDKELFFLFDSSFGSTESPLISEDTKVSLSWPGINGPVSLGNASAVMTVVNSHQKVLSTLYNPNILGNDVQDLRIGFNKEEFHESQCIANFDGRNEKRFILLQHQSQAQSDPNPLSTGKTRILGQESNKNDIWLDLFGEKIKFSSQPGFNTVEDTSLGFLLGYDRFMSSGMMTGALGYNYSKIKEAGYVGRGDANQIFGIYEQRAFLSKGMYLAYSLYGALNFNDFHRFVKTGTEWNVAKSSFTSGTLVPHIDFGYDWCVNRWFILEPFIFNDFFFNFQPSYSEKGASGFNAHQDAINSGLYEIEPGVNLYQQFNRNCGLFIIREEVGYKRVQPMFGTKNIAAIVGVVDGIETSTGLRGLNLFIFEFEVFARAAHGFYGDVFYRGEFGTGLISNILHLNIGHFF